MKRMMMMWAMLALTATACGGAGAQAKNESCCDDKAAALAESGAAPVAGPDEAVCPVSGEKFKPDANTKTAQYKGKTVYFCCPGCDKKFAENPAKYEGNIAQ